MQIHIEELTKSYANSRGITGINLCLPERGLTAIVGPSGCGKTTLLRTLAGFLQPDSGRIRFGEREVTYATPQQRGATMVFQNYALWPHMSVFDNVAYGLKLRKVPAQERERLVLEVLARVEIDLSDIKKRRPQQYSGGQQQRIALARALVVQPDLLLMDEPLSNLDAKVRQRLRVEIRRIQQSFGITALYVTHDQEEALSMADYVVVMNEGRVEQAGTPEEVYRQPISYFAAHFLGESHTLQVSRGGEPQRLVLRSNDARIGERLEAAERDKGETETVGKSVEDLEAYAMQAEGGLPQVYEDSEGWYLYGEVQNHLFVGAVYRHLVSAFGQSWFVDAESAKPFGTYCIRIPREKAYWFAVDLMQPDGEAGMKATAGTATNREEQAV
ncbi:ABC transporter ATP-binding protein [Paenibacillus sp. N3.4]|uniref:ABC transporter ATP-binding protein n=1 Tax=Paenibacillus sp. N3.4 TaxID=2603222 RepID=UPI0011C89EC9|nr:ABC transporter ATP-binding protein [Paenibacillus sp. N3.4]TXK76788.1 ABC transporter ATP-binding protein [Paenibacillus sp. N3.4]